MDVIRNDAGGIVTVAIRWKANAGVRHGVISVRLERIIWRVRLQRIVKFMDGTRAIVIGVVRLMDGVVKFLRAMEMLNIAGIFHQR